MGRPSVYPTGTTIYNRDKAYSGYTLYKTSEGAALVDMNGNLVRYWKGLLGMPHKLLPGGYIMGSTSQRSSKNAHQDFNDLVVCDFEGKVVWRFDHNECIKDPEMKAPQWMLRQHHDYQRAGSTTGYYYPGAEPKPAEGNTIILTHTNVRNERISSKLLMDDRVIEVTADGDIVWEWKLSEHFDELGFDENAKMSIYRDPNMIDFEVFESAGDWAHVNCVSVLGENKWFDAGDSRFAPENLILDCREANIMFIVSKKTGEIVWRIGPDFTSDKRLEAIGQIIGQHHCHMIPRGLPGEGNILVFDNGGMAGYGAAGPGHPDGRRVARRHYSRVLELNPVTLEVVWTYPKMSGERYSEARLDNFFSCLVSSAQRLPNGNTFIDEGGDGKLFEVTPEGETVWEYMIPYRIPGPDGKKPNQGNAYRAYRYPYSWVPQLELPVEKSVIPPENETFRVPGAEADIAIENASINIEK